MEQSYLNWSKTFGIKPNDEILDFIVQSHKGGYYFAVAIHFRENKNRQNKMIEPAFTLVTKNFGDTTEDGILAQLNDWIKSNFPSKTYEVVEKEHTSY